MSIVNQFRSPLRQVGVLIVGLLPLVQLAGQSGPQVVRKTSEELLSGIVHWQEPEYPAIARAARASGPVVVEVIVDTEGNVVSARAVSGHPLLRTSTVKAARAWRFKPTLVNNTPVRIIGRVTYEFPYPEALFDGKTLGQLQRAARRQPRAALARYELGVAYLKSARYEEAVKELITATRLNPRYANAYLSLGHAYWRLHSHDLALVAFEEALRHNSNSAEALQSIGFTRMSLGQYHEALTAFKRSLEVDEPITSSYFMIGKCYVLLDQPAEAIAYYQKGLAMHDSDMGHYGLGEAYLGLGRFDDAIRELKQALALSDGPGKATTHYQLGRSYLKAGDTAAALKEYETLKMTREDLAELLLEEIELQKKQEGRTKGE